MRVFISGATSSLGKAIAKTFASFNYDLILTYHTKCEECELLKKELEDSFGISVDIYKLDIRNEEEIVDIVNKYDNVDILINNAAYTMDEEIFSKSVDTFKRVIDTNVVGTFLLTREVGKKMLKNKSGSIVNISSTNGMDTNYPESIDYDASKAAVNSMTLNFADAFAPYVRVNSICPGWINTSINKDLNPNFKEEQISKILLHRFAEPKEIAKTVYNVATDTYMNKSIIRVDGGHHE